MMFNNSINFTEIHKLNSLLIEANIPHTLTPAWDGLQIRIYEDNDMTREIDDCIIHSGSFGYQQGLLESNRLGDCSGWETAEQIYNGWIELYHEAQIGA